MSLVLLLAAAAPLTSAPAKPPCKPAITMARERQSPRIRPLAAMPPARQIYGVYHQEGGCTVPIVVRERVGSPSRP